MGFQPEIRGVYQKYEPLGDRTLGASCVEEVGWVGSSIGINSTSGYWLVAIENTILTISGERAEIDEYDFHFGLLNYIFEVQVNPFQ